jgi:hypothetical protein
VEFALLGDDASVPGVPALYPARIRKNWHQESVELRMRGDTPPRDDPSAKGRSRSVRQQLGVAVALLVVVTMLVVGSVFAGVPEKLSRLGAHQQGLQTTVNPPPANPEQAINHSTIEGIAPGQVSVEFAETPEQGPCYWGPGDYIDIFATVNTKLFSLKSPRMVSRRVFDAVRVLRVEPAPQGCEEFLTVAMSPCDARYAQWFIANAQMRSDLLDPVPYDYMAIHTESCGTGNVSPAAVDARYHFSSAA